MSPNLGPKLYQILSYPDRWKTFVNVGEGITYICIPRSKRVRNRFRGVLWSFSLFSAINFFQNFRQDFSRFLHIWPIFGVSENRKNVKNLDQEEPDPRSEFRAWERFIDTLSGKKGFFFMTFKKKIFDHLRLDMVIKIMKFFGMGRWPKKVEISKRKIVSAKFLLLWDLLTKGVSSSKRSESLSLFVFEKKAKVHRPVYYLPCCNIICERLYSFVMWSLGISAISSCTKFSRIASVHCYNKTYKKI